MWILTNWSLSLSLSYEGRILRPKLLFFEMEGNQVVKLIVTQPAPHDGDDEVDNGPFFRIMLNVESEWEKNRT